MTSLASAVRAARARRAAGSQAGMTLAEVLVTVTLLGTAVAGITGALGTAAQSSASHQQQVTLDTVLRGYAERIKEYVRLEDGYQERTADHIPDYSSDAVGFELPDGYEIDPTNIQYQCSSPLNVVLVLDLSTSIADADAVGKVKDAAKAFLRGLADTTARVALVGFGSKQRTDLRPGAEAPTSAEIYRDPAVVRTNLDALVEDVNRLPFGPESEWPWRYEDVPGHGRQLVAANDLWKEYTNWDAGLVKAKEVLTSAPGDGGFPLGQTPLVVVVTDGVPNRWLNDSDLTDEKGTSRSGEVDGTALEHAENQAADIEKKYARIFAVGVGSNFVDPAVDNPARAALLDISGPSEFPNQEPDFAEADWTKVSDFGNGPQGLQTMLATIAQELSEETFSETCTKPDQGVQLLTLTARSASGLTSQTLQVVVRRP